MLSRYYHFLIDTLAYAAATLLFVVMLAICAEVCSRFFFAAPIGWVSEFVQHSMLLILFLGLGWLTRQKEHIAVDIVLDAVPKSVRRSMEAISCLLCGVTSGFLAWYSIVGTWDNYVRDILTEGIYPIPRYWLLGTIALGFALCALEFLRTFLISARPMKPS